MLNIIEEILDVLLDVFLLRKIREQRNRPKNTWSQDAADVVYLDWWLATVLSLLAVVGFVLLFYVIGLPFWLSFGLPTLALGGYLSHRWLVLTKR